MNALFIHYPKCTTCQKAEKWLKENNIPFTARNIVTQNPTEQELSKWIHISGKQVTKFFNTSGLRYKALNMKDVVDLASEQELITILASEGMLIRRPLLIKDDIVLSGFKEQEWADKLLSDRGQTPTDGRETLMDR